MAGMGAGIALGRNEMRVLRATYIEPESDFMIMAYNAFNQILH